MKKLIALLLTAILALSTVGALADIYSDRDTVKKVQQALNDAGYDCGTPDGAAGNKTYAAIEAFYRDKGYAGSIAIDDALLERLGLIAGRDSVPRVFVNSWNTTFESGLTNEYSEALQNAGITPEEVMDVFRLGMPMFTTDASGKRVAQSFSKAERLDMTGTANGSDIENIESVSLTFLDMPEQTLQNFWHQNSMYIFLSVCDYFFGATAASRSHVNEVMNTLPYDEAQNSYVLTQLYVKDEETLILDTGDYKVTYKATGENSCDFTFTVYPPEPVTIQLTSSSEATAAAEQAAAQTSDDSRNEEAPDDDYLFISNTLHDPLQFQKLVNSRLEESMNTERAENLKLAGLTPEQVITWYKLENPVTVENADKTSTFTCASQYTRLDMKGPVKDDAFEQIDSIAMTFVKKQDQVLDGLDFANLQYILMYSDFLFISNDFQEIVAKFMESATSYGVSTEQWYAQDAETLIFQGAKYCMTYKFLPDIAEMTFTIYPGEWSAVSNNVDATTATQNTLNEKASSAVNMSSSEAETSGSLEDVLSLRNPIMFFINMNIIYRDMLTNNTEMYDDYDLTFSQARTAYALRFSEVRNNNDGSSSFLCDSDKTRLDIKGTLSKGTFEHVNSVSLTFTDKKDTNLDKLDSTSLYSFYMLCDLLFSGDPSKSHFKEVWNGEGYSKDQHYTDGEETLLTQTADYYITYCISLLEKGEMTFTVYSGQKP